MSQAQNLFDTKPPAPVRSRWKSLTSNTTKVLRLDGDRLYVETVLPDEAVRAGAFIVAELKKTGDGFVGVIRSGVVCTYEAFDWNTLHNKTVFNRCNLEGPFEIRLFSSVANRGCHRRIPTWVL